MPNYKSKMLTFLSIGEMTGLLLDNTDEDGILFAVTTDSTNFKIVMWRKNSTATIDNETVYPVNGPGRWHVLATGNGKEVMTVVGDTLPGTIAPEIDLIAQKKTNGDKILKGRFNGIFEDFSANNIAVYDDSLGSATPPSGMKMAVVNKTTGDELYVAKNNTWELLDIGGDDTITFADLPTGTTSSTVAIGNHSHALDNLSDVIITSPANGDIVSFDGINWINQTPVVPATNLDGLSDVIITSPVSGNTLSFNGSTWVNTAPSSGGGVVYLNDTANLPATGQDGVIYSATRKVNIQDPWGGGQTISNYFLRRLLFTWVQTNGAFLVLSYPNIYAEQRLNEMTPRWYLFSLSDTSVSEITPTIGQICYLMYRRQSDNGWERLAPDGPGQMLFNYNDGVFTTFVASGVKWRRLI